MAIKIPTGIYWGLNPVDDKFIVVLGCKVLSWIIAIANSIAVYVLMPKTKGVSEGRYTLFYYLFHTILLFPVFDLLVKYIPNTFFSSLVVLLCVVLSLFLLRRIKFLNDLLNIGKI